MGEIVLNHLIQTKNASSLISRVDSCGTIDYHAGDDPDPRCLHTAIKHMGNDIGYSKSRKIRKSDFSEFDYILCCDQSNLQDVKDLRKRWKIQEQNGPIVALVGEWDPQGEKEMRDPYYDRGSNGFEDNYHHVTRTMEAFIEECRQELGKRE